MSTKWDEYRNNYRIVYFLSHQSAMREFDDDFSYILLIITVLYYFGQKMIQKSIVVVSNVLTIQPILFSIIFKEINVQFSKDLLKFTIQCTICSSSLKRRSSNDVHLSE